MSRCDECGKWSPSVYRISPKGEAGRFACVECKRARDCGCRSVDECSHGAEIAGACSALREGGGE